MLVMTLILAAAGFALLVAALMTGSVVWAWACIIVCVAGAVLLLVSALTGKGTPAAGPKISPPADADDSHT
ncbi:MAG: hypothetical protein GX610_16060 [Rhodococcus sp.]|nr:hypothetical protein [Rhodococcus sp. (in: high G+C Gram-positive bacteria)]